jgi:hypothetical protein
MTNFEKFREAYVECLTKVVTAKPDEYAYPISEVPEVVANMTKAILAGESVSIGPGLKATARKLGIKSTMTAIREYLDVKSK